MIDIPNNCPKCDSVLERVKDQLFCRNSSCSAKSSKQILHFIKVMKIKGLGEKTLEKMAINNINELYLFSKEQLIELLGEKIGTKLFNEITNSKIVDLATFITSFGIPLIGNSASTKLAAVTDSMWNIDENVCKKAGLGSKATDNLLQWISENKDQYSILPITTTVSNVTTPEDVLYNVVITGKLDDFSSRTKAKQYLESKGVRVMSSISSGTNYLICDQGVSASSSFKKAEKLNIEVITMNKLLNNILGDINVTINTKME